VFADTPTRRYAHTSPLFGSGRSGSTELAEVLPRLGRSLALPAAGNRGSGGASPHQPIHEFV
jgi:hypothetical protein